MYRMLCVNLYSILLLAFSILLSSNVSVLPVHFWVVTLWISRGVIFRSFELIKLGQNEIYEPPPLTYLCCRRPLWSFGQKCSCWLSTQTEKKLCFLVLVALLWSLLLMYLVTYLKCLALLWGWFCNFACFTNAS